MKRRIIDLDAPERFVALRTDPGDQASPAGFLLQAVKGRRSVAAAVGPEQLAFLAEHMLVILGELERRGLLAIEVGDASQATPEAARSAVARAHARVDVRAETLAVAWEDDGDRLIIEAVASLPGAGAGDWALPPHPLAGDDEVPDDDPLGPDVLRLRLQPVVAQRFVRQVGRLLA